jgi:thioredoxin-related protein
MDLSPEDARDYLKSKDLTAIEFVVRPSASFEVRATPTLLLVDRSGVVLEQWIGKLPPSVENELLNKLQ